MVGEWQTVRFERLLIEPVRNGIYKPKEFHGRGAKIVNMGELFAHPRLHSVPMKRVEMSSSEGERFLLSEGDLLFARRSLVAEGAGKCSIVLQIDEPTTFESSIIRARPNTSKAEPLYLYYFFNSVFGLHCLDTIRRQVAVSGITGSDLSQLEIPVPSLIEQRAIGHILSKSAVEGRRSPDEIDHAIRQIVSRAVSSDEVIDIFAAAGLKKPDISILSEEFLAEVRGMPQRNLAVEMLRKLLDGEVKRRSRKNIVQGRSFAEMLENAIKRYQARAIEAAQVIEELIALAKDMREADRRGEALGLTEDEVAFYDALETNDSAMKVLGDQTLRTIAQELLKTIRNNVTIDWTVRENVRAQMRVMIKRILRRYGYPPDKQARATELVLEQAEVLSREWAEKA